MGKLFAGIACAGRTVATRFGLAPVLAAAVLSVGGQAHAAWKLEDWAGYWAGTGQIQMTNGSSEQVKCVVTYKVTGQQLRQNVRCASQGYNLNGTAELVIAPGGDVTGTWIENTYSANGAVTGRTTDTGFKLDISGPNFTAVMDASTTACKQTLDIVPTGMDVAKISIGLGKC